MNAQQTNASERIAGALWDNFFAHPPQAGMQTREQYVKWAAPIIDASQPASAAPDKSDPWFGENIREAIAAFAPANENIMERTPLDALNCVFFRIAKGYWKSDNFDERRLAASATDGAAEEKR